jgi:hypothetical protein
MPIYPYFLILIGSLFVSNTAIAQGPSIVGNWQHESEPLVVEMRLSDDVIEGFVISHENKPEAVGKKLFRTLRFDESNNCWRGFVYVARLGDEKQTCLSMQGSNVFEMTVKAGFFSKTVLWNRAQLTANNFIME